MFLDLESNSDGTLVFYSGGPDATLCFQESLGKMIRVEKGELVLCWFCNSWVGLLMCLDYNFHFCEVRKLGRTNAFFHDHSFIPLLILIYMLGTQKTADGLLKI